MRHRLAWSVAWLWMAFAAPLAGQSVVARALDAEAASPVAGALAYLERADGSVVRNTLSDIAGRAVFADVAEGTYVVRFEMIGRETTRSENFQVTEGTPVQVDVALPSKAIRLEGIEVSTNERCQVRPEEGLAISLVWEEARKALAAASYTEQSDLYRYRTERYELDLDRDARRVRAEDRTVQDAFMRVPFQSRPAVDLVENGFVQEGADGQTLYFAPDALVLLSDPFLDAHCFQLREGMGEAAGLLGVAFEPAAGRGRRIPDISGTLWVDPATAELRWLDYRYENVLPEIATDLMGGRVAFERLPDGTWIVPDWWIRMPRLVREFTPTGRPRLVIDGYRQTGGRLVEIVDSDADVLLEEANLGSFEGFVQDSLGVLPLRNVRVSIVGSDREVLTDREGRFRIDGLRPGTYEIQFEDTRLEEFGLSPEPLRRRVFEGEISAILFRMPPLSDLLFEACRSERPPEGSAVLTGRVLREDDDAPVAGVTVKVRWQDVTMAGAGTPAARIAGARIYGVDAETDENGMYRFCAVPEDTQLSVFVEIDGRDTEPEILSIPEFGRGRAHRILVP